MVIKANLFHRFIYMANSSAYSPSLATGLAHLVSEKLTKGNHLFWKAQVVLTIHAAQLASYLDGTKPAPPKMVEVTKEDKTVATISNPEFATWEAQDQLVLGYLLSSISREILVYVAAMKTSAEAKEAAKQWANGNQNVANNAPSKKIRNLAGHKKKVEQFRIEEYLTGIEQIDDDLRKLIGLFNQMIPLVKAAQEESLSPEGLSDVNREMKFATDEMRVLRKKINGKGGKAPIIPPQFLERYY